MATITKGKTFINGELVTPEKLHQLVDAATVTAIATADISNNAITTTKIADSNVTTAKIADSAITSAKIADGTIVNADISASAAIALSKLATGALPTAITVASANIVDGTIVNADIAAGAAIADTKLATISTANKVAQSAVANLTTDLAGKAASSHTHTIANVTGLQTALDGKQASGSYAAATHTHAISDTTGLQTALDGKAASSHTHTIANVTGLQTALDGKQASGSYAPATGIAQSSVTNLTTDLAGKAASSHTHDDRYYTETEIDTKLSGLPVSGHTHSAADITSGTLANARTTATNANTANAIVARDASGNFSAGTITANLTGNVAGNASTATKLATARTITLGGDLSGSVSFDGSANATLTAAVLDDSHNHIIANVDGLQTALDGKQAAGSYAAATHTHATATATVGGTAGVNGFMSAADKTKLDGVATGANNYVHPTGDGNLHVPATSTTNSGKVLKAGVTAGALSWGTLTAADVGAAAATHTHDDRYYTESEMNTLLAGKQAAGSYVTNGGNVSSIQRVTSMPASPNATTLYIVIP